jgi:hypothetical protein
MVLPHTMACSQKMRMNNPVLKSHQGEVSGTARISFNEQAEAKNTHRSRTAKKKAALWCG